MEMITMFLESIMQNCSVQIQSTKKLVEKCCKKKLVFCWKKCFHVRFIVRTVTCARRVRPIDTNIVHKLQNAVGSSVLLTQCLKIRSNEPIMRSFLFCRWKSVGLQTAPRRWVILNIFAIVPRFHTKWPHKLLG